MPSLFYIKFLDHLDNYWASVEADNLIFSHVAVWRYTSTSARGGEKKTNSTNWSTICTRAESGRRHFTFWPNQQNIYTH